MEAIQLSNGLHVQLIPVYTPKVRKRLQSIIVNATSKDIDAAYEAVSNFIQRVYRVDGSETADLSVEALLDCSYDNYIKVVDGILELIKFDESMHKAIGVSFGRIKLTDEELAELQKKIQQ